MKIGVNTLFLIPGKVGGTETYARGLLKGLEKINSEDEYIIYCNQENYSSFKFRSKHFHKVTASVRATFRPLRILWEQLVLPLQVWRHKIDVLISLGYVCPLFTPCRSIVVIFDLNWFFHPEEFSTPNRLFWKILVTASAKRAHHIVTSSSQSKKDIIKVLKVPKEKVSVIYGGIDMSRFKSISNKKKVESIAKKYGIKGDYILAVSAAYKFKNLAKLIDAFSLVSNRNRNLQLIMVGLGGKGKDDIQKKIKTNNLTDRVVIPGWVPDGDIPILYSGAKVFVHPSLYEGFGFPVLEAMACGCPVISSDAPPLPEIVGKGGILVNARDYKRMADVIYNVVSKTQMRLKMIKAGNLRYRFFSWEESAKKVLNIL